ncbi:MAG: hypothetical protein J5825_03015 [Lachnospiraceae bacterium]|nr:hypothetical protein [Lachnospiraceae bacterium]
MPLIISGTASFVSGISFINLLKVLPDLIYLIRYNPLLGGVVMLITILLIASLCKLVDKAEEPWWSQLVPFYNAYVLAKITFGNGWFFLYPLLGLIPFIGGILVTVLAIFQYYRLAKAFGLGILTTLGLIFLPFVVIPFMAFSPSVYFTGVEDISGLRF